MDDAPAFCNKWSGVLWSFPLFYSLIIFSLRLALALSAFLQLDFEAVSIGRESMAARGTV